MSEHLFVYGTLRRGHSNYDQLMTAIFIGPAATSMDCALYLDDYPYLNPDRHVGPVKGEVYELSPDVLRELDEFEGVPVLYQRVRIAVVLENQCPIEAWTYVRPDTTGTLLRNGEFPCYSG